MPLPQLKVYTLLFLVFCASVSAKFSYERGNCEILVTSAIREILMNEMRAQLDPSWREWRNKRLRYDLYTPLNPYKAQVLVPGDRDVLRTSYFNAKWPVRLSIHGWTGKSTSCSNAAIKDAYLEVGNFNVILLDWSTISMDISYGRISRQLSDIAKQLVEFTRFLHREAGIAYESIYMVGHSAGAHIAGLAGKLLSPQRFGVIYALDPAGLVQLSLGEDKRLAPNDAIYTESIHTDITLLGNPSTKLTHAAFFVNWGLGQPHCPNATAAEFDFACDHFAALYYFVETVRQPRAFGAAQCRRRGGSSYNNNISSSGSSSSTSGTLWDQMECGCTNGATAATIAAATAAGECTATAFMGGEPAVPKNGTFYLSTRSKSPPFGFGETVRIRRAAPAKFLHSSFLNNKFINSMLSKWHK
ncbi:PREDICTED: phospholipase A1 member A [Rhagoletis zephyria]|uniref:phospholipase A1 member A n=1 Tax=Rhagoletis zephyria TaxID=28612 RepID=UPI00081196DF|nr:PREDICTED: phospholipase A1 member A [Rhagoletis zephyria]